METTPPLPADALVMGRYRPVAVLGSGGMGCVYEAVDERLGRPVALKLVHTTDPTSAARLRAEAAILGRLHHPHLVTVYDVGDHEGRPFVVTELVRGHTLRRRMDEGPVPAEELARIGDQVSSALACAHSHGVVHRDITPGNVLLTDGSGDARLIDFGIAVSRDALALTATGLVIGTPAYLSPEQVEGSTATAASDVYSLGIVLLEALTGRRVFQGTPTESAGARLVGDAPVPDDLPEGWGPLLASMTSRDPDRRPDAAAVAAELSSAGDGAHALRPDQRGVTTRSGGRSPDPAPADETVTLGERTRTMAVAGAAGASAPGAAATTPATRPAQVRQESGRSSVLRRRWPIAAAGLALLAGLFVLAMFSDRTSDAPVPGVDPATADQVTAPSTTVATTPVATATAPTTAPVTTTAPAANGGGPGANDPGKGKAKGKGG